MGRIVQFLLEAPVLMMHGHDMADNFVDCLVSIAERSMADGWGSVWFLCWRSGGLPVDVVVGLGPIDASWDEDEVARLAVPVVIDRRDDAALRRVVADWLDRHERVDGSALLGFPVQACFRVDVVIGCHPVGGVPMRRGSFVGGSATWFADNEVPPLAACIASRRDCGEWIGLPPQGVGVST